MWEWDGVCATLCAAVRHDLEILAVPGSTEVLVHFLSDDPTLILPIPEGALGSFGLSLIHILMTTLGIEGRVITLDRQGQEPSGDGRITALTADALNLGAVLHESFLGDLPRPWLVIDDAVHTFEALSLIHI